MFNLEWPIKYSCQLESSSFFKILNKIGIETEESQHDNLKLFLCIDPSYHDKFSIDKIKMILEEFKNNAQLRERAQKYYNELVNENELQEEPDINHGE